MEIHPKKCRFFSIGIACTAGKVMGPRVIFNCNDYNHATYSLLESAIHMIITGYVLL